jgi:hypothetical protein
MELKNIHEKINYKATFEAWANITIKEWRKKLQKMKIHSSGALAGSFQKHIIVSSKGDFAKIVFLYRQYGAYIDMGVGNGQKIGNISENKLARRLEGRNAVTRRRAKKWYSKTLYHEIIALADLIAKKYGDDIVFKVIDIMPTKINIKL